MFDSGDWPAGPYDDAGGEADSPQHCGACRTFLENPLTGDGYAYAMDLIIEHEENGRGDRDVLQEWATFYRLNFSPSMAAQS